MSHSSISSAIVFAVPTMARPVPAEPLSKLAHGEVLAPGKFDRRCRPLLDALLSGMSGSGPSGSNLEASWPSAIESEPMALA